MWNTLKQCNLVVNSVKGTPGFGEDSPLYEAMGNVRKSERRSGLSRGRKAAVVTDLKSRCVNCGPNANRERCGPPLPVFW